MQPIDCSGSDNNSANRMQALLQRWRQRALRRLMRAGRAGVASLLLAISCIGSPAVSANEPPVPPGLSAAGAVMIALLGPGIDYRLPELQRHLARDGEGDLIGWDFSDSDNRPFAEGGPGTEAARIIATHAPNAQLICVKEKPGEPHSFGHLMTFVANTPARIIVWLDADPNRPDWPILAQAIKRFSDRLFIIGTIEKPVAIAGSPQYLGVQDAANALIIAADDTKGAPPVQQAPSALVTTITITQDPAAALAAASPAVVAATIASALAARAFHNGPQLSVANVKELIATAAAAGIFYQAEQLTLIGSHPELALR